MSKVTQLTSEMPELKVRPVELPRSRPKVVPIRGLRRRG